MNISVYVHSITKRAAGAARGVQIVGSDVCCLFTYIHANSAAVLRAGSE